MPITTNVSLSSIIDLARRAYNNNPPGVPFGFTSYANTVVNSVAKMYQIAQ